MALSVGMGSQLSHF